MKHQQDPSGVNIVPSNELELFSVARITKTRGLRGEVKADILTDFPDRFAALSEVCLQLPGGGRLTLQLEDHWFHQDRVILKFVGYDTIDQAESLVGGLVMVGQDDLVALDADEFFHFDLIGCEVMLADGATIGHVTRILETGGTPLLTVKNDLGREHLIPFADDICPDVDVETKRIVIDPPEGLLDL